MTGVTAAQIRMLYALARERGMDSDDLHARVFTLTGKEHIKALTVRECARVIDGLTAGSRATQGQINTLLALSRKLGWYEDPKRLTGWIHTRYGASSLRTLTAQQAQTCIETLKAMLKGGRGERKGAKP